MMQLTSGTLEANDLSALQEIFHSRGWSDGKPIMPPTADAVRACLEWALTPPDQIIGVEPVRNRVVSAEKVAVNAVMAGCLPMHFPLVVTAWTALLQTEFLLHGATSSTGGCAVFMVINGDVRLELGCSGGFNALGGSDRATTVIGRAIRLGLINILDVRPGGVDRSTFGHPGKFSFCIAEDEEATDWIPLAQQRDVPAGASAVTVMAAGSPRQVMNEWTTEPQEILETYAAEMRANMRQYSIWAGNYAIVIAPQHREHLLRAGWSKADIAEYIFERARVHRREWAEVGKGAVVRDRGDTQYKALTSPDDLLVISAGGPAGGFGAVIPPWLGQKSTAVTEAVGVCLHC